MHWRVVFSRSFSLVSSTQFSCMCTNVKYTYIFVDMFSYVHLLCFFIYSIMYLFCLFIYVCVWYTSICTCSPHVPAHAPKTLLFQLQCLTINPSWSYDIYIYIDLCRLPSGFWMAVLFRSCQAKLTVRPVPNCWRNWTPTMMRNSMRPWQLALVVGSDGNLVKGQWFTIIFQSGFLPSHVCVYPHNICT